MDEKNSNIEYVNLELNDSRTYWHTIARPDCEEFLNTPNIRRMRSAVSALVELIEWYADEQGKGTRSALPQFREELCDQCPELALLRDVNDTFKHKGLGRRNVRVVAVPHKSGRGGAGGWGMPSGGWGVGTFALGSGQIEPIIETHDGSFVWVVDAVEKACRFWEHRLST